MVAKCNTIRTPLNVNERMRMRPKMGPQGFCCLAETFACDGVGNAASPKQRRYVQALPGVEPQTRPAPGR